MISLEIYPLTSYVTLAWPLPQPVPSGAVISPAASPGRACRNLHGGASAAPLAGCSAGVHSPPAELAGRGSSEMKVGL